MKIPKAYYDGCDALAKALCKKYELESYWVGGEIGDMLDCGDTLFFDVETMLLMLKHDLALEVMYDYNDECFEEFEKNGNDEDALETFYAYLTRKKLIEKAA